MGVDFSAGPSAQPLAAVLASVPAAPAYWRIHRDHAPLWLHQHISRALSDAHAVLRTFAQCAFDSPFQKWTTVAHPPCSISAEFGFLDQHACQHGRSLHLARAHGLALALSDDGPKRPPELKWYISEYMNDDAILKHVALIIDTFVVTLADV